VHLYNFVFSGGGGTKTALVSKSIVQFLQCLHHETQRICQVRCKNNSS